MHKYVAEWELVGAEEAKGSLFVDWFAELG